MSGRAFLRALAGRLREALLGRNRSGGTAPRRGAHHATGGQMVTRATGPRETGRAQGGPAAHGTREDGGRAWGWRDDGGRAWGGRRAKGEYDGIDKSPYTGGPTKGAYGGDGKGKAPYEAVDEVPYTGGLTKVDAKGKGPYEGADKGPYTAGDKGGAKGDYNDGGQFGGSGRANGGAGGGDGAKGRRRRRRTRGKYKEQEAKPRGWWRPLATRIRSLIADRNWIEDLEELDSRLEQAERARRLTERLKSLSAWVYEGVLATGVAVTVGCNKMVKKLQAGTAVAKDKVLELKDAVKEKLSPGKGSPPKVSVKDGDDQIRPHALDFAP